MINIFRLNSENSEIKSPVFLRVLKNEKGRAVFLNSTTDVNVVAFVEFLPNGDLRGNHYHHTKREFLYIIEGKLKIYFWRPPCEKVEEMIAESGCLVTIEPHVGHAFEAIQHTIALEMGSVAFNPDDTVSDIRAKKANSKSSAP